MDFRRRARNWFPFQNQSCCPLSLPSHVQLRNLLSRIRYNNRHRQPFACTPVVLIATLRLSPRSEVYLVSSAADGQFDAQRRARPSLVGGAAQHVRFCPHPQSISHIPYSRNPHTTSCPRNLQPGPCRCSRCSSLLGLQPHRCNQPLASVHISPLFHLNSQDDCVSHSAT